MAAGKKKKGAGGGGFSPSNKTGLQFWAKGDGVNYVEDTPVTPAASNGDRVGYLTDFSGNSKPGTQSTTADKGTLRTGANGINNLNCIRLDGVSDFFACSGLTKTQIPTTGDAWFVMVLRIQDATPTGVGCLLYLGNGNLISPTDHFVGLQLTDVGIAVFNNYDGSEHKALSDGALSENTTYLIEGVRVSDVNKIYVNGTLQAVGPASGTPNVDASATFKIGVYQNPIAYFTAMDIGEICVYNSAPTAAERTNMLAYMDRWGY